MRWGWCLICALLGSVMFLCGLLVPAHLRAVDANVLAQAGRSSASVTEQGLTLLGDNQFGAAQLLYRAAETERLPRREKLGQALSDAAREHPAWPINGGGDSQLQVLFKTDPKPAQTGFEPFTDWIVRLENRGTVFELLQASSRPAVQELLHCRMLTNTLVFSPSRSASGQAFDAALSICGLLLEERKFNPALSNSVVALAAEANRGASTVPLENLLLDLMSLGQRFNWSQLSEFVGRVPDPETLRLLTNLARQANDQLPLLFSAVEISGQSAEVARYLMTYSRTGLDDLGASLRYGQGGIHELMQRNQRLSLSPLRPQLGLEYCWREPWLALGVKWLLYFCGGFLIAAAMHFAWRTTILERPLQVRGVHIFREVLFALGFLAVVLLLSEPFLAQESQRVEFPFRLHLPTAGSPVAAGINNVKPSFMNQVSILTLLLFFVLQGLIYVACLVKLAEIRRQQVPQRVKLKLLENEDHLFDAGLYLGFVGTIISLILVSLGIIKFSLMAAYSSTSFGIIFVSFFKIFHLRPLRRKILLEAEANATLEPVLPPTARLAASS
jgi:hypothetical protein